MNKKRIALVYGGNSREREISIKSGKAVEDAIKSLGYEYAVFDPADGKKFIDDIYSYKPDLAFLVLHGKGGEDGIVQAILEFLNIPYTGSDHTTSAIAIDKFLTKLILKNFNINVPDAEVFYKREDAIKFKPDFPVVVKAATEGSSIGVYIVNNLDEYQSAVNEVFEIDEKLIVERYIRGRELTVGIVDGKVYDIVEVKVLDGFYDFNNKYVGKNTIYECPAKLEADLYSQIQEIGLNVYKVLNCKGAARVDIILSDDNIPYVLEINTIPGMTQRSLLPKAAAVSNVSFNQLVDSIIKNSLKGKGS